MNEKNGPIIGSSEWIEQMAQTEAELKAAKANRQPVVNEHVNLNKADAEARIRRKSHPTYGSTRGLPLPVGASPTVGESSRGKDSGK